MGVKSRNSFCDILLHSRRSCRLQRTDKNIRKRIQGKGRDAADRGETGSGKKSVVSVAVAGNYVAALGSQISNQSIQQLHVTRIFRSIKVS